MCLWISGVDGDWPHGPWRKEPWQNCNWSGVMTRLLGLSSKCCACRDSRQTDPCGQGAWSWCIPRGMDLYVRGEFLTWCIAHSKPTLPQARLALHIHHSPRSTGRAWYAVGIYFILGLRDPWWPPGHSLGSVACISITIAVIVSLVPTECPHFWSTPGCQTDLGSRSGFVTLTLWPWTSLLTSLSLGVC